DFHVTGVQTCALPIYPPTVLKLPPGSEPPGERVISEKTSTQMRKLMRLVVENGTAKLAAAPGYVVGGKTGTAEKNLGGRYQEKKIGRASCRESEYRCV